VLIAGLEEAIVINCTAVFEGDDSFFVPSADTCTRRAERSFGGGDEFSMTPVESTSTDWDYGLSVNGGDYSIRLRAMDLSDYGRENLSAILLFSQIFEANLVFARDAR